MSEVVSKGCLVSPSDLRRPVFHVAIGKGRSLVVKQASPLDTNHVRMLDREAAFAELVQNEPWAQTLADYVPKIRHYDRGVHVLISESISADTVWNYLRTEASDAVLAGMTVGRALAATHISLPGNLQLTKLLTAKLPWVLQLNHIELADIDDSCTRALLGIVRDDTCLRDGLLELEKEWLDECLVHGDAKLDNILFQPSPKPEAWIVDWAFSGVGDAAWDVACSVQSSLLLWFLGVRFIGNEMNPGAFSNSVVPFERVRGFSKATVSEYVAQRKMPTEQRRSFLLRVARYTAAALIQATLADAKRYKSETKRQLRMLQMSSNILLSPERAVEELLWSL